MTNQLEKLYNHLIYAEKLLPRAIDNRLCAIRQLHDMREDVARLMAKKAGPKTMAEVRTHHHAGNPALAKALLYNLLEQSPESRRDYNSKLHGILDQVGVKAALAAPVESPSEFAAWLRRSTPRKKAASA